MILVQVPPGIPQCQIEFPENVTDKNGKTVLKGGDKDKKVKGKPVPLKRQKDKSGSMHIRPGSTMVVNEAELYHLQLHHKDLRLHVVGEIKTPEGPPKEKVKEKAKGDKGAGNKDTKGDKK